MGAVNEGWKDISQNRVELGRIEPDAGRIENDIPRPEFTGFHLNSTTVFVVFSNSTISDILSDWFGLSKRSSCDSNETTGRFTAVAT